MFSTTPDLKPDSELTAVNNDFFKLPSRHFNIRIAPSSSAYLFAIWAACLVLAVTYTFYFSFGWLGLVLWLVGFTLFLRVDSWNRGLSEIGYDGQLFVVVHDKKIAVAACQDVRVFPYCVLAIAKLESHSSALLQQLYTRSIALNLNRKNLSEDDLHTLRRFFSKL